MKAKLVKRMVVLLSASLLTVSVCGCGNTSAGTRNTTMQVQESESQGEADASEQGLENLQIQSPEGDLTSSSSQAAGNVEMVENESVDVLDFIRSKYATSSLPEDYNQPLYDLPHDHVFEFECSEEAGYIAYDAFKVYDNSDYENVGGMVYNRNVYEDGKIKVVPDGALYLNENGSSNTNDGTWGSLNQLYLVQYIDLTTGEKLEKPLVTPFTVEHEVQAPMIQQGVDEKNSYVISWEPVEGAVEYRIYEHFGNVGYKLECTTSETAVSVEEFESQKRTEEYLDLLRKDLEESGYNTSLREEGIAYMNKGVKFDDEMEDGYFVVVAVDSEGKQSGISNIVDVRDIAGQLPYTIADTVVEVDITDVNDIPAYVNVEMVDGSIQQMIIDFHGAKTYTYEDDQLKMSIQAGVANTLFNDFLISIHGMKYEDVMADISVVVEREDELLSRVGGGETPKVTRVNVTTEETEEKIEESKKSEVPTTGTPEVEPTEAPEVEPTEAPTEEPTEEPTAEPTEAPTAEPTEAPTAEPTEEPTAEPTEEPTAEPTEEPTAEPTEEPTKEPTAEPTEEPTAEPTEAPTAEPTKAPVAVEVDEEASKYVQLFQDVSGNVQTGIQMLGAEKVESVLYASNDMGAWMAMCLMTQSEVIPVPIEIFPDAANIDYVYAVLTEAFRQNPTAGMINNFGYSPDYQAIIIEYTEDRAVRLEKTQKELQAAYDIANQITDSGMTDYEKVFALNEYFRINASYDFDSTSTEIEDNSTLSEQFIDAHTPYGIICLNYGVCESYSEAFALTARMAGLEAMCDFGTLHGGAHEWNRVKVDDSWCILDVTNNDIDYFTNGLLNVSEEQVEGILVSNNGAYLDYQNYAAKDETKEYYYMDGRAFEQLDDVAEEIAKQLESSDIAVVRVSPDVTKEELGDVLQELVYEHGVKYSKAGENFHLFCVIE